MKTRAPGDASLGSAIVLLMRTAWRASAPLALAGVVSELTVSVAVTALIYGFKVIVDGATAHDTTRLAVGVLVVSAAAAARQVCSWANTVVHLGERMAMTMEAAVIDMSARLPGIEHHERPDLVNQMALVREKRFAIGDVVRQLTGNVSAWVATAISLVLLARLHPLLVFVPLGGLVSLAAVGRTERLKAKADQAVAADVRLALRLEELAQEPAVAGELRLHRLPELLLGRHREAWENAIAVWQPVELWATAWNVLGIAVLSLTQLAGIAFLAWLGANHRLGPGDVVLGIGLVIRAAGQLNGVVQGIGELLQTLRSLRRLAWLEDEVAAAERRALPKHPTPAPDRLREGIRFEGVWFTYPGARDPALKDVNLVLPAHTTVAVVGENGAGKSTFVKLLLRMYDPAGGRILVDGADLRDIPVSEWRGRASGAFQDATRFELIAQEVVGVGDITRIEDEARVLAAVGMAGAEQTVARLPYGLATPIGPSFESGVELSDGQWQLLALARGMMRDRPLLLILDEPTAALDPGREHALFERYREASQLAARETGGVTVLVSHRFSTVRMADLIVVIDGGRVREVGSHDELMGNGGLYSELFRLQARAYS